MRKRSICCACFLQILTTWELESYLRSKEEYVVSLELCGSYRKELVEGRRQRWRSGWRRCKRRSAPSPSCSDSLPFMFYKRIINSSALDKRDADKIFVHEVQTLLWTYSLPGCSTQCSAGGERGVEGAEYFPLPRHHKDGGEGWQDHQGLNVLLV